MMDSKFILYLTKIMVYLRTIINKYKSENIKEYGIDSGKRYIFGNTVEY